MIKYTVLHIKNIPTIVQIECEKVFTYSWELLPGESKYKILSPEELANEVWHSWAIQDTEEQAKARAIKELRHGMERDERKKDIPFSEEEFFKKATLIITKRLK